MCVTQDESNEYHFDFDETVYQGLISRILNTVALPITYEAPALMGVYALFWKDNLVYIGKAISTNLQRRIIEHWKKIDTYGDTPVEPVHVCDITYRFLTINVEWLVWAAESTLIKRLKPPWNNSGFGRHSQGSNRNDGSNMWDCRSSSIFPSRKADVPLLPERIIWYDDDADCTE